MNDVEKGPVRPDAFRVNVKPPSPSWTHPADKFWATYLEDAEKQDTALAESWKGDTDGILIFTGLFAAVVASFVVESTSTLQPDPNAATVALLAQISTQLSGAANSSDIQDPKSLTSLPFTAPTAAVRLNALFMTSLVLALACALSATLAQQWARRYKHAVSQRGPPHVRGPLRMFLYEGLSRFRFVHVLGCVVALLHGSVFLFVAGLVDYFNTMNNTVSTLVLVLALVGLSVYTILSIAPLFAPDCPYSTPLTEALLLILATLCYLASMLTRILWTCKGISHPLASLSRSMVFDHGWAPALKQHAARISVGNLRQAVHSTLRNIDEEHEFEAFFDSLPGLLDSLNQGSTAVAGHLVHEEGILSRVLHLLIVPRPEAHRVRVCTATIRALTRRALGPGSAPTTDTTLTHSLWRIIDRLGSLLQSTEGPITLHAACTLGTITADLLDSMDRRVEIGTTSTLAHGDMSAMFTALLGDRTPSGKVDPESSPSIGGGLWVAVEGGQLNLRADGHLRALLLLLRRTLPLLGPDTPQADVDVLLEALGRLHPARAASIPLVLELRDQLDALGALCTRQRYSGEGEALRRVHLALLRSAAGLPGLLGTSVAAIRWKEDEDGMCGSYGMPM
ncbi:hypothetical protein PENSPDRAFT_603841 [Peniophora sp. CONT]|nr:hypothetical protein PENSPDRAFT_603841 [Peniophora sp. CONT]